MERRGKEKGGAFRLMKILILWKGGDMAVEYLGEMAEQGGFDRFGIGGGSCFPFQGSDAPVGDAAGDDVAEIPEVGIDVQGKSVHGHPTGSAHAYCTDLPGGRALRVYPYA